MQRFFTRECDAAGIADTLDQQRQVAAAQDTIAKALFCSCLSHLHRASVRDVVGVLSLLAGTSMLQRLASRGRHQGRVGFLGNLLALWQNGDLDDKRLVLKLAFAKLFTYGKGTGLGTTVKS